AAGALDRLEAFASRNGAAFYGLPPNGDTITLVRRAHTVPESFPLAEGGDTLVGLFAGETIEWQMLPQGESA
ncbi:MAG: dihydroorotase, partial [Rhodocyclaceae bacterium]|nr:dihydroorotase [Rhodocyclaceae bacterium]